MCNEARWTANASFRIFYIEFCRYLHLVLEAVQTLIWGREEGEGVTSDLPLAKRGIYIVCCSLIYKFAASVWHGNTEVFLNRGRMNLVRVCSKLFDLGFILRAIIFRASLRRGARRIGCQY